MTKDTVTLSDLAALVEELHGTRTAELEAMQEHKDYVRMRQEAEASTIALAYERGTIDGKNKDIRDAQEAALLARDDIVSIARHEEICAERAATEAKINRLTAEDRASLIRAWLYAQSRIER